MKGPEFEWLPVSKITIDHEFQRDLRSYWVRRIVGEFDPDKFGSITLSRRGDGTLVALDGQHRLAAAMEALGPDQLVPCLVYEGATKPEEAAIFMGENTRLSVSAIETYRAALTAQEAWAVRIHKLLEHPVGYKIAPGGTGPNLQCVMALKASFDHGHLDDVVKILHGSWPFTAWQSRTVRAVTSILIAYPALDAGRLIGRLHETTETDLASRGRRIMEGEKEAGRRSSIESGMTEVIVRLYNRGLRANKIKKPPKGWPNPSSRLELAKDRANWAKSTKTRRQSR